MKSRKLLIASALGCSIVFLLILMEGVARIVLPIPTPPAEMTIDPYQANPYITYRRPFIFFHIPGSRYYMERPSFTVKYEINSHGFRGPEIAEKTKKRMIVIGDSVVEGHGVSYDATFSAILNDFPEISANLEIINCGMQGASPIYFAANLQRYLALNPDIVLIHLFSNDLYEDREREKIYFTIPFVPVHDLFPEMQHAHSTLFDTLHMGVLFKTIASYLYRNNPLEKIINANVRTGKSQASYKNIRLSALQIKERWPMSQLYLDYFLSELKARNIGLCLVYSDFYDHENRSELEDSKTLEYKISHWAGQRHIPYKSLLPLIEKIYESHNIDEIILHHDGHPTIKTHALLATELKEWLLK